MLLEVLRVAAVIVLSLHLCLSDDNKWVWSEREGNPHRRTEGPQARYEIEEYPESGPDRPGAFGFGQPGFNRPLERPGCNSGYCRPGIGPGVAPGVAPGVGPGIRPGYRPEFGPGIRPGYGGFVGGSGFGGGPGFGGRPGPGFGGPGFGGVNPGIGGVNPGIGGVNPGIGGYRPGGRPGGPGFGVGGGYGNGGSGILTGPVPSWAQEPPIKNFDRCKCTEKFNCNSPGISYGHCDVGKKYCCYNTKDPLSGGPIPARPVHSIANGILAGPGGPVDPIPGAGQIPPGGVPPYPRPGPYELGNGVLIGPGGPAGYGGGFQGPLGPRPHGFRPEGLGPYSGYGLGQGRPIPYDGISRSNKPKEDDDDSKEKVEN